MELSQSFNLRHPLLWQHGSFMLVLSGVLLILLLIDHRQLTGVNVWLKPLKFSISIWIYLWTVSLVWSWQTSGGLYDHFPLLIVVVMWIEMVLIVIQAARGVQSHFNQSSALDGIIFGAMGLAILLNTILILAMLVRSYLGHLTVDVALTAAYRWGFWLLLAGSVVGGMMGSRLSHSIGVQDGGSGLPFLNWSTRGGDLRVAHFFGLHAPQLLIVLAYLVRNPLGQYAVWLVRGTGALALLLFLLVLRQALKGKPLSGL